MAEKLALLDDDEPIQPAPLTGKPQDTLPLLDDYEPQDPRPDPEVVAAPSKVETQVNYLNEIAKFEPLQGEDWGAAIREVVGDPKRTEAAAAAEIYKTLHTYRIIDTSEFNKPLQPEFIEEMKNRGSARTVQFLKSMKLDLQDTEEDFKDKRLLHRQGFAFEAIASAPISRKDTAGLVRAVVTDMLDRRLTEMRSTAQAVGAPLSREGTPTDIDLLNEYRTHVARMTDDDAMVLYRNMLNEQNARPVNSVESQLLKEGSTDWLGVAGLRMSGAPGKGWEGHPSDHQYYGIIRYAFGSNGHKEILEEFNRNKVRWIREKLGFIEDGKGNVVTGQRTDGQNFILTAPTGAAERIVGRAIAAKTPMVRILNDIRQNEGRDAALNYLRASVEVSMKEGGLKVADAVSQPRPSDRPLTEAEKSTQSAFLQATIDIYHALDAVYGAGRTAFEATDRLVNSSDFVRNHVTQQISNTLGGGYEVRNLSEALTSIWFTDIEMMKNTTDGIALRAQQLGYSKWGGQHGDAEAYASAIGGWRKRGFEAVVKENSAIELVREAFPNMYATVDKNNKIIGEYLNGRGDANFFQWATATMGNIGATAFAMPMEMAATVMDDPYAVGGFMAQALAMGPPTKIASGAARKASAFMSYTWRLQHDLANIAAFHPEAMARFKGAALDAMRRASDADRAGLKPGEVHNMNAKVKTLQDLVAQLETFEQYRRENGLLKDPGEAARVLRKAFPDIKDGLGDLGVQLGSNRINRGLATEIKGFANLFNKELGMARPNKATEALLGSLRTNDVVINVLQDLTGARGMAQELANAKSKFVLEQGREPTTKELVDMAPEPVRDMYNLMVAAERTPIKEGLGSKIWHKVFPKSVRVAEVAATKAETLINQYLSAAVEQVEHVRTLRLTQERVNTVLDLAKNKSTIGIQELQLQVDLLLKKRGEYAPKDPMHLVIKNQVRDLVNEIRGHQERIKRIEGEQDALWRQDSERAYQLHPEVQDLLFGKDGLVPASSLESLMNLNPALFDGMTGDVLFKAARRDLTAAEKKPWFAARDKFAEAVEATRKRWRNATKAPILADAKLQRMRDQIMQKRKDIANAEKAPAEAGTLESLQKGRPLPPDKNPIVQRLREELREMEHEFQKRTDRLKSGEISSAEIVALEAEYTESIAGAQRHGKAMARMFEEGVDLGRQFDPVGHAKVMELLRYKGKSDRLAILDEMRAKARQSTANAMLGIGENPFAFEMAPPWYKIQLAHQQLRAASWEIASNLGRAEGQAKMVMELNPAERNRYMEALKTQDKDVILNSDLPTTSKERLEQLFNTETNTYRQVWQILDDVGKVPKAVVEAWKKGNYDPRLSGLVMRTHAARGPEARRVLGNRASLPENPELSAMGLDWSEFSFRREPGKWRLRIQQNDVIVDKLFDTEQKLQEYMEIRYGKDAFRDLRAWESDGTRRGRTFHGEPITIGKPLTPGEIEIYDAAIGMTPETRQLRLHQVLKDAMLHMLNEGMNSYGNMIMDDAAFKKGGFHLDPMLRKSYAKIADGTAAQQAFGNLAGKWVHRSILREMGDAARVYDHLGSITEAWRTALEGNATFGLANAADVLGLNVGQGMRAYRKLVSAVKDNMIIKSARTWVANVMFWAVSDYISGSNVLSIEGLPILWENLKSYRNGEMAAQGSMLARARRQGLVGGMFENDSALYTDMARRVFGYENVEQVRSLRARRQELYDRLSNERLGDSPSPAYMEMMEKELLSLQLIEKDMTKGILSKGYEKTKGLFLHEKNVQGVPLNRTYDKIRGFYNHLDTAFKVSQFEMFIRQGMDDVTAGNMVRMFTQDYGNLPSWIRQSNPLLMSLVPAFPFEASRILANAMVLRPGKALGMLSILPAMNLMSFAAAGIDWDKAVGMIAARGKSDPTQAVLSLFRTVYLTDPRTGNITDEIDVGGWFPFASLGQSTGFLSRTYDKQIPPERRGTMAQFGALGVRYMSNYFLANPAFNAVGGWLQNVDTITGEPLTSQKDSAWHNIKVLFRQAANQILPPIAGGRDWEAYWRSREASPSPRTGRLFKADQEATTILRSALGVTWRGKKLQELVNATGLGSRAPHPLVDEDDLIMTQTYKSAGMFGGFYDTGKIPTYGEYNEMRNLAYASIDTALTQEQRDSAYSEAKKMFQREITGDLDSLKGVKGATERQFVHWIKKAQEGDPLGQFTAMNLIGQTHALIQLNSMGLRDSRLKDIITEMQMTDTLGIRATADEEMVNMSLQMIDHWIRTGGNRVNQRIFGLRDWIDGVMRAQATRRMLSEGINEIKNDALGGILSGGE